MSNLVKKTVLVIQYKKIKPAQQSLRQPQSPAPSGAFYFALLTPILVSGSPTASQTAFGSQAFYFSGLGSAQSIGLVCHVQAGLLRRVPPQSVATHSQGMSLFLYSAERACLDISSGHSWYAKNNQAILSG